MRERRRGMGGASRLTMKDDQRETFVYARQVPRRPSCGVTTVSPSRGGGLLLRGVSLLKSRLSRLICVLRTDPLLAGHGQMAWDPPWDTAVRGSHAPGVGAGEPRTSTTSGCVEGAPAAAAAEGDGPDLLGRAVEALEELAECSAGGAAPDGGAVAPSRLQSLLDMEESTPTGSARD